MGGEPIRRGKPVCMSLDFDAHQLLYALLPRPRAIGAFVSELIRREAREQAARDDMIAVLIDRRKKLEAQMDDRDP
jgi:hypothetical protein